MQLFKKQTNIDFMGKRTIAMVVSGLLLLVAIFSIVTQGLNLGVDFTGGTLVEVGYAQPVELPKVRAALESSGFDDAMVQYYGSTKDVLIRLGLRDGANAADISSSILAVMQGVSPDAEMRRIEFVGPQVGKELTEDGGLAMLYALFGILIYVTFRFEKRFALASVVALVHDVVLTLGFFSLLQLEFNLSVLAAILAVIGYSLNDTIVVFDRIRENFRVIRKGSTVEIVNISINQTLSRTIITSLTTFLVLLALFLLGGEIIHGFATALIFGIVVGTYSSIYVASSSILALGINKSDLIVVVDDEKEGESREIDRMP